MDRLFCEHRPGVYLRSRPDVQGTSLGNDGFNELAPLARLEGDTPGHCLDPATSGWRERADGGGWMML